MTADGGAAYAASVRLLTDGGLSADDIAVRELVRGVVEREVRPRARGVDENERFPAEGLQALATADLLGLLVPEELGGTGATKLQYVIAVEEVAAGCGSTATTFMTQAHGSLPILIAGSSEQQKRWLPDLCAGRRIGAIAFTEPAAGSDLAALALRADLTERGTYELTGQKLFITNGGVAQIIVVLARTGPGAKGLTAMVVDGSPAGLVRGTSLAKMGIRGSSTVELFFDGVEVPVSNRLGDEGDGFAIAMRTLDGARLSTAAQAVGLAQGALDRAVAYAAEREQFGRPIRAFQAISFKLVDMYAAVAGARSLLYDIARRVDAGATSELLTGLAAMVKVACSDMAMRVTTEAVQVLGGYGYLRDYEVERAMRDAKITQIYDGTNEINRLVAARTLGMGTP